MSGPFHAILWRTNIVCLCKTHTPCSNWSTLIWITWLVWGVCYDTWLFQEIDQQGLIFFIFHLFMVFALV